MIEWCYRCQNNTEVKINTINTIKFKLITKICSKCGSFLAFNEESTKNNDIIINNNDKSNKINRKD